jgi:hypothetical protein
MQQAKLLQCVTTTSPAFGARRGGDPGQPSTVDSNASLAREVERNPRRDNDFL